jgi:hypothetical protein
MSESRSAIRDERFGVSPRDPLAFSVGPAMSIVVAALAIVLPARRAMHQDPIVALRAE